MIVLVYLAVLGWYAQLHIPMGYVFLAVTHTSESNHLLPDGRVSTITADDQVWLHGHLGSILSISVIPKQSF